MLSKESTEEDVIKFFIDKRQIKEDVQNNIKKENITGDVLPLLNDQELKSNSIGLKFGPLKNWKLYFEKNKDKFKEKEIEDKIFPNSSPEEVVKFLKNSLNIEISDNLNGEKLLALNEEDLEKIGLSLGKRKKLLKYIEYFRTLKQDKSIEGKNDNLIITKKKQ